MGLIYLAMGMSIQDNILMASQMVMDSINGIMGVHIQESLKMGLNMGKGSGRKIQVLVQIPMKEIISRIKNMGKESLSGKLEISILVGTKMMIGRDLER